MQRRSLLAPGDLLGDTQQARRQALCAALASQPLPVLLDVRCLREALVTSGNRRRWRHSAVRALRAILMGGMKAATSLREQLRPPKGASPRSNIPDKSCKGSVQGRKGVPATVSAVSISAPALAAPSRQRERLARSKSALEDRKGDGEWSALVKKEGLPFRRQPSFKEGRTQGNVLT